MSSHNQPAAHPPRPTRPRFVILIAACAALAGHAGISRAAPEATVLTPYYHRVFTHNNLVGLTVTNYGFLGTNLTDRQPSFEYPLGSGLEHLVRAGLWVGGRTLPTGGDTTEAALTHVSIGCADGQYNANPGPGTEFTPLGTRVIERSTLPNNKYFSHEAVSEQDFIADFTDSAAKPNGGVETHKPLNIDVRWEAYNWSFDLASSFVVLHTRVTNRGPLLRDVYIALYSQVVSNNKKLYVGWPPNASSGPRTWFYATQLDYIDSLNLMTEHYCASPRNCATEQVCPAWAGVKYLGTRTPNPQAKFHWLWYPWDPSNIPRGPDAGKYALMADTAAHIPTSSINLGSDSPVELFSLGPFPALPTDSSAEFDVAFIGGSGPEDLKTFGDFAQLAFDLHYVLPTPPPSPRLRIEPHANALELFWDGSADSIIDPTSLHPDPHDFEGYRIYVGEDNTHLALAGEADVQDSVPPNAGLEQWRLAEPRYFPGDTVAYRYHYTLGGLRDGFKYAVSVTSFDKGDARIGSLESGRTQNLATAVPGPDSLQAPPGRVSVFPNPYRVEARWDAGATPRYHYLWFVGLPSRAKIRIYTLGGDLVKQIDFDAATYHGADARGVFDAATTNGLAPPRLSGSMAAWDLISAKDQSTAAGIYLYSVEDLSSGQRQVGKFAVLKSDR